MDNEVLQQIIQGRADKSGRSYEVERDKFLSRIDKVAALFFKGEEVSHSDYRRITLHNCGEGKIWFPECDDYAGYYVDEIRILHAGNIVQSRPIEGWTGQAPNGSVHVGKGTQLGFPITV